MLKSVRGRDLKAGMKMALPFKKSATIVSVRKGNRFMNFETQEYGKSRVELNYEVMIESDEDVALRLED